MAKSFPIKPLDAFFGLPNFRLRSGADDDLADITDNFKQEGGLSRFQVLASWLGVGFDPKVESHYEGRG